jgi:hypothetical protein
MKKDFIPYEQALALKGLGFGEPCYGWFDTGYLRFGCYESEYVQGLGDLPAPLYQQAFRWFREKHNILATVYSNASGYLYEWSDNVGGTHRGWSNDEGPNNGGVWDTYEEAELACLKKLIELSTPITKP